MSGIHAVKARDNRAPMQITAPPRLLLAPMEGLMDFVLRDILTRAGGVAHCVSEFIRVTDTLLPERVFFGHVPELRHGSCTASGVPVRPQLLGSDPVCLADNAARLASLGAAGVDLNFGCPSKVVNRHRGGAALLEEPELLYRIVCCVRQAVPKALPVSAKMRLGLHDDRNAEACALAIEAGGATELVVHARTKDQAYRPPAYWARVGDIRRVVKVPLVANGEIWSVADAQACRAQSGCEALMLGRGLVARPALAQEIAASDAQTALPAQTWAQLLPLLADFWQLVTQHLERRQQAGRLKQWLYLLQRNYPQAQRAFAAIRVVHDPAQIQRWFDSERAWLENPAD